MRNYNAKRDPKGKVFWNVLIDTKDYNSPPKNFQSSIRWILQKRYICREMISAEPYSQRSSHHSPPPFEKLLASKILALLAIRNIIPGCELGFQEKSGPTKRFNRMALSINQDFK